MKRSQALIFGALLIVAALAVSAWYYPHLPAKIPTHWDLSGNPNGYSSKFWGVLHMPALMLFLWLLLLVLPVISPKGFRLDQFLGAFDAVLLGLIAALLMWNIILLREAVIAGSHPSALVFLPIGIMFIVIGNFMGKFRKNFFIGVRTPWTLASDEVWARTHRLAGWLFIAGGLALMASAIVGVNTILIVTIIGVLVVVPIVYSFLLYRKIEGFSNDESTEA